MAREFRVEDYGPARDHHLDAMNFHLQLHLETFDNLYAENGGIIGSLSHQFEREQFARSTSESLIKCQLGNSGEILALATKGKHYSSKLGVEFEICTESYHGNQTQPSNVTEAPTFLLN